MSTRKKAITVWLARDPDDDYGEDLYYRLFVGKKPKLDEHTDEWDTDDYHGYIAGFCPTMFERMCSVRLKPGQCKRMQFRDPFSLLPTKRAKKKEPA